MRPAADRETIPSISTMNRISGMLSPIDCIRTAHLPWTGIVFGTFFVVIYVWIPKITHTVPARNIINHDNYDTYASSTTVVVAAAGIQ